MPPNTLTRAWLVAANASAPSPANSTSPSGEAIGTFAIATSPSSSAACTRPTSTTGASPNRTRRAGEACAQESPTGTGGRVSNIIRVPIQSASPRTTGTSPAATVLGFSALALTVTGVVTTVSSCLRWSSV